MTTAVVILNWNGRGFLESYLPGVVSSLKSCPGVTVVVADNGSTDDSASYVRDTFPDVIWLPLGVNHGFAKGYNEALKFVRADCFLLLNSDIRVEPGWFEPLEEWMELHPDCGICGPKLHKEGPDSDSFEYAGAAGGYIDRYGYPFCRGRVMTMTEKDEGQYDLPADVLWVSGAALMIRSSLFFELGGFWEPFFAHMEEIDLCWRARSAGWRVSVVPRSVVYHIGGASLPASNPYKTFLNYRNNLLLMDRNMPFVMSLNMAFNVFAREVDPDEGADFYGLCSDVYHSYDTESRTGMLRLFVEYGAGYSASLIRFRMFLDLLSAVVYLMQGKYSFFKAVLRAHREFRRMRCKPSFGDVAGAVETVLKGDRLDVARLLLREAPCPGCFHQDSFGIAGIWDKWIVFQTLTKKEAIFAEINRSSL